MNDRDFEVTYGQTNIIPARKSYDPTNWYPRPYVELAFLSEEEKQMRNAQEELARRQRLAALAWEAVHPTPPVTKCARCQREIKPQYTYCYRCNNYLKVKARIAS